MPRIVAINQNYIDDARLDPVLQSIDQKDRSMLKYFCDMSAKSCATQLGLINRAGTNILPFNNDVLPLIDCEMPEFDPTFSKTWEEVTDQRALDVQRLVAQGKKVCVFWSGGIDSTCILTAILKNFDQADLSQITVALTCDGVVENPVFYHKHILPNFPTVDTNWYVNHVFGSDKDAVIVEGFAADTLTMSMTPSLDVCMAIRHGELLTRDWRDSDALIAYLARVTQSREFANWYYEKTRISVESVDVPIETYFDFMWWIGFNCEYYTWALHTWFFYYRHLNLPYSEFQSKCMGWYRTNDYQLWAMANTGSMVKHGVNLGSLKRHPKQYIYEFDHNEYYFKYKTKVNSPGRISNPLKQQQFAITDSFDILYLDRDLDKILELLPSHLK